MSIKSKGQSSYSSSPTFGEEGKEVLSSLQGLFNRDPSSTSSGQFFLDIMSGNQGPDLREQIGLVTQASASELPKELSAARSMTRGRPDTFGGQTAANVTADNLIKRDLTISQLLREQENQDRAAKMAAGTTVAGMDANRFGQGMGLLSALRGESGTGSQSSSQFNPYQLMSSAGGFMKNMTDIGKPTK